MANSAPCPWLTPCAHPAARDGFDLIVFREGLDAAFISFVDAGGQHRRGLVGFERRGGRVQEPVEVGALESEHQPRVGAELPGPHRQRRDELAADRVRARRQGGGQEIDGVAAAHLGIDRDRLGP